jgi:hypothetical protein
VKYYSWDLKSKLIAVKTMDKSVFKYRGTGIPTQVRKYFNMENMKKGESREITLIYQNVPFSAHPMLKFEKTDEKNRYYISFVEPKETFEEQKISWKEAVLEYIKEIPQTMFTLPDIYKFEPELKKQFPSNIHIQPKIRQQIQFLRDDGYIEFVDNRGTYRKLFENEGELGYIETIMNQVDRKNYRVDDSWGQVKIRKSQDVFRKYVLRNFEYQCCICQFNLESLLDAHHIRSWKVDIDNRLNPLNGLSLCRIHHGAVDQSILRVKKDYKIIVDQNLMKTHNPSVRDFITRYHNRKIVPPVEGELLF